MMAACRRHRPRRRRRRRQRRPQLRSTDVPDDLADHGRRARRAGRPRQGRRLARRRRRPQADQPRQAAVRAARARRRRPDHEARAHPLLRADRADDAAPPRRTGRSTCSGSPTAPARPGFWQKDIPDTAPTWLTRWHETGVEAGPTATPTTTSSPTAPRPCAGSATRPASRSTPGPGACPTRGSRPSPSSTSTPGEKTTWDETLVLARLYRTALGHLGVRGYPKTTGKRGIQVWIPIVPEVQRSSETSAVGRARLAGRRRDRPGARLVGVGEGRPARARPGSTTPRTRRSRRSSRRTPSGPRPGAPGLGADHLGRARRPGPAARPLDDPDDRRARRRASATCSRRAQTDAQELPEV